jgi:hypothetical protein
MTQAAETETRPKRKQKDYHHGDRGGHLQFWIPRAAFECICAVARFDGLRPAEWIRFVAIREARRRKKAV